MQQFDAFLTLWLTINRLEPLKQEKYDFEILSAATESPS